MRTRAISIPVLALLAACANPGAQPASSASPAASAIVGTPAPGSKFSRVRIGMGKKEVEDLIGQPTDQGGHITGKAFIPFYFGGGTSEIEAHYKGEGILTYASRNVGSTSYELIGVTVDRRESGYER